MDLILSARGMAESGVIGWCDMARARNIKPAFFQDDRLGELSIFSRMAFIGLWTLADFKGCLEFRPKMIKVQLLPYDECNIEEILNSLEQARFIRYYAECGKKYIKIVNFEKHQNPHKNERDAGSEIPDFNENNALTHYGTKPDLIGTARADSLLLIPDSLNADSLIPDSWIPEKKPSASAKAVAEKESAGTELQEACKETWARYCNAYLNRYGTEPIRNAGVNSMIKQFVQKLGFVDSPFVAEFYVQHNDRFYVQKTHPVSLMSKDAEGLRTQWATGRSMTATRASQIDKSQANYSVVEEALALMGGEHEKAT